MAIAAQAFLWDTANAFYQARESYGINRRASRQAEIRRPKSPG